VRREYGATVFINSATAATKHDHGRMRAIARRKEQRADDALRADRMPRHAGACHAAFKDQFSTRSVEACRLKLNEPRLHDEVGGRLLCLARQSFSRPNKPHRRYAIVGARHRGLMRDVDATVVVAHEGCARLPA
jgi:hypothetical protein